MNNCNFCITLKSNKVKGKKFFFVHRVCPPASQTVKSVVKIHSSFPLPLPCQRSESEDMRSRVRFDVDIDIIVDIGISRRVLKRNGKAT